jgi:hypothetical protein
VGGAKGHDRNTGMLAATVALVTAYISVIGSIRAT